MQPYGDPNQAPYQRPPSTATYGTAPPPTTYAGNTFQQDPNAYQNPSATQYQQWPGVQQVSPLTQQAWPQQSGTQFTQAPHTQTPQSINQAWGPPPAQQQQQQPSYNPSTYDPSQGVQPAGPPVPPKAYQNQTGYNSTPPPPPPKHTQSFDQTPQQTGQTWNQQPAPTQDYYQHQHLPSISEQGQSTYGQYATQPIPQPYNSAAPPPPSQTPGGSYFPPSGASNNTGYDPSNPPNPAAAVLSPDEQHPAYIPPSLSGQGTAAYMPSNTNPMPGVYVPPPPDIPAWSQATHAPLGGPTKKFTYTRPMTQSDSVPGSTYQAQNQYNPQYPAHGHHPSQSVGHGQVQSPVQQTTSPFGLTQQFNQSAQPPQQQFNQTVQQPPQQLGQAAQQQPQQFSQTTQPPPQQYQSPQADPWNAQPSAAPPPPPYEQTPVQAQQQQGHAAMQPAAAQPSWQANNVATQVNPQFQSYGAVQNAPQQPVALAAQIVPAAQAAPTQGPPVPFGNVTYSGEPVSPISHRQSTGFNQTAFAPGVQRTDSTASRPSTTSLYGATYATGIQRTDSSASRPSTTGFHGQTASISQAKESTPSPPLKATTGASALGFGGPSDWEYFDAGGDEVDDTAHFETKGANRPASPQQLDSVELPAQPSSPPSAVTGPAAHSGSVSAQDNWPTPPAPAPLNLHRPSSGLQQNTTSTQVPYAPTPPPQDPGSARPLQSPPRHVHQVSAEASPKTNPVQHDPKPAPPASNTFVMGDGSGWTQQASIPPVQTQSPQQNIAQSARPAPVETTSSFVMDDGGWQTHVGQTSAPAQPAQPAHAAQVPTGAPQSFVMDGGRSIPPVQAANVVSGGHQISANSMQPATSFVVGDGSWASPAPDAKALELSKKEEQLAEQSRELSQREQSLASKEGDLTRREQELSKKEQDISQKERDLATEQQQYSDLKQALSGKQQEATAREEALASKEKDLATREQDLITKDRDVTQRELDVKQGPAPRPADIIPDLDPWYVGSLERFLAMLRTESAATAIDDKIKVFTDFLATESQARGIAYYRDPPSMPAAAHAESVSTQTVPALPSDFDNEKPPKLQRLNTAPATTDDAFMMVEHALEQYSPGGRPLLVRQGTSGLSGNMSATTAGPIGTPLQGRSDTASSFSVQPTASAGISPIIPAADSTPNAAYPSFRNSVTASDNSVQSAIMTPTSSAEEEAAKAVPPPQPDKPVYKPYTPGESTISSIIPTDISSHRQSLSLTRRDIDDLFLDDVQPKPQPKAAAAPKLDSTATTPTNQPVAKKAPAADPLEALRSLLPAKVPTAPPSYPRLSAITSGLQSEYPSDFSWIGSITSTYDKSASGVRSKNEAARRQRQEESEARTDELFNNNEIAYADISGIEEEFRAHEAERKRDEDKQEYDSYVSEVFNQVYGRLQKEIGSLMENWVEVEGMLPTSASGKQLILGDGADDASRGSQPTTLEALQTLRALHGAVEARHAVVVSAVAERDKRYKKTEVAPLYAVGQIAKVKSLERHFDMAEKNAVVNAREDKVTRMRRLITTFEDAIIKAVANDQTYRDDLLDAVDALVGRKSQGTDAEKVNETAKQDTMKLVGPALHQVSLNSRSLMTVLGEVEVEVLNSVLDVDIAKARARPEGVDQNAIKQIEDQRHKEVADIEDESKRRLAVLEADERNVDALSAEMGGTGNEQEERMRRALEEAKKRNGQV